MTTIPEDIFFFKSDIKLNLRMSVSLQNVLQNLNLKKHVTSRIWTTL